MTRLVCHACVGLAMAVVGVYGLFLAFVAVCRELAQPWGDFSTWCRDLVQGGFKLPPETFRSAFINAELTWVISSIVPLILLGLGLWLFSDSLDWFSYGACRRRRAASRHQLWTV